MSGARGKEWVLLTKAACFPAVASQACVRVGVGALPAHGPSGITGGGLWGGPWAPDTGRPCLPRPGCATPGRSAQPSGPLFRDCTMRAFTSHYLWVLLAWIIEDAKSSCLLSCK